MRLVSSVIALTASALFGVPTALPAYATTYILPLDGSVAISDNAASSGPTAIEVQAIESFSLPVFNQQNPQATAGVYQWIASFSVFDQSGSQISEPALSPLGTSLTGYGQNCSVTPYCPHPSGPSSETILSGTLFISGNSTLDVSSIISGMNIVSSNLELELTLPSGFTSNAPSIGSSVPGTPLPAALPLFASGLSLVGLFCWRKRRRPISALVHGPAPLKPKVARTD
jgi:hypothetical protein